MVYRIEIWRNHVCVETRKSNDILELLKWYDENWKPIYDICGCTFYLFKHNRQLSFDEEQKLGFHYEYGEEMLI